MSEELTNDQIRERLAKIREANRRYDRDEISWEERVRLHEETAPGIGDLAHQRQGRKHKDEEPCR